MSDVEEISEVLADISLPNDLENLVADYGTPAERVKFANEVASEVSRRSKFDGDMSDMRKELGVRKSKQIEAEKRLRKIDAFVRPTVKVVKKMVSKFARGGLTSNHIYVQKCIAPDEDDEDRPRIVIVKNADWTKAVQDEFFQEEVCDAISVAVRQEGYSVGSVCFKFLYDDESHPFIELDDVCWDDEATRKSRTTNASGLTGQCPVCLDDENVPLKILIPCGHAHCFDCCGRFVGKDCPVCRNPVTSANAVFTN